MNHKIKKIGIIARGLTNGGVGRFVINILGQFSNVDLYDFYVFTDRKDFQKKFKNLKIIYIKKSNKLYWDYVKSFFVIRKYKLDTILYLKNIIPFTHIFISAKKINIVYDLGYFYKDLNAYKFWDTFYMKSMMKLSCSLSDKIISISNSTKNEIIKNFKINPRKITVVYLAVAFNFNSKNAKENKDEVLKKFDVKKPFIFYCGSLSPRKNILRVLKSFNQIKDNIPHNIYLANSKSWKDRNVLSYIKNNLSDRVFNVKYLTEKELPIFYSEADLFLYPSLYEGFGIPILEAQICECPVLTSNATSCPEVAEKGAHIVNPYSVEEIKKGMLEILENKNYQLNLITEGNKNIKRFSWRKTSDDILKLV